MEGGHRKVGNVQVNFCSPLDPERGCISKPTAYTISQFKQLGLAPAEDITNEDIIGTYNSAIKSGSNGKGFFYDTAFVGVRYRNDPDVPVK